MEKGLKARIKKVTEYIGKACDEEQEKIVWDKALDLLEMLIEHSHTKLDDFFLKPVIHIVRNRFRIPDDPGDPSIEVE